MPPRQYFYRHLLCLLSYAATVYHTHIVTTNNAITIAGPRSWPLPVCRCTYAGIRRFFPLLANTVATAGRRRRRHYAAILLPRPQTTAAKNSCRHQYAGHYASTEYHITAYAAAKVSGHCWRMNIIFTATPSSCRCRYRLQKIMAAAYGTPLPVHTPQQRPHWNRIRHCHTFNVECYTRRCCRIHTLY